MTHIYTILCIYRFHTVVR